MLIWNKIGLGGGGVATKKGSEKGDGVEQINQILGGGGLKINFLQIVMEYP